MADPDERVATISLTLNVDFVMTRGELWPDGDDPEHVTAQAVAEMMKAQGGKRRVLKDWNLLDENDIAVAVWTRALGDEAQVWD